MDDQNLNHYFAGDLHLGHANVLRRDNRPFPDIETHDQAVRVNMRPQPGEKAELWLMGDVGVRRRDVEQLMEEIRPHWQKIHLIRGNHDDRAAWRLRDLFDSANEALYVQINPEIKLYLSHYAHRVWRNSHHGSIHIHAHSHGSLPQWGRSIDSFIGNFNWGPASLRRIIELVGHLPVTNHHPERHDTRTLHRQ